MNLETKTFFATETQHKLMQSRLLKPMYSNNVSSQKICTNVHTYKRSTRSYVFFLKKCQNPCIITGLFLHGAGPLPTYRLVNIKVKVCRMRGILYLISSSKAFNRVLQLQALMREKSPQKESISYLSEGMNAVCVTVCSMIHALCNSGVHSLIHSL